MRQIIVAALAAMLCPWAFAQGGVAAVLQDPLTVFFVVVNVGIAIYFSIRFDRFAIVHGPEVLTTIGIFGCFIGISLSMLHFDASNVSASVPQLLDGVKTAFVASVSGVGGALWIRGMHYFRKSPLQQSHGAPKAATLDDVVLAMQQLQRSLSGTEEGTLLSQLKLMRQDQSDQLGQLRTSFDSFSDRMAKDGSKALIDALREVISDFNAQINEQFGDNFKQLNAAVERLVIWQQQYKEELDKLQALQRSTGEELRLSSQRLSAMVVNSESFTEAARSLERLLAGLATQYASIEQSQRSLSTVLVEMKGVAPQLSTKLEELADSFRSGVAKVQADTAEVVRNLGSQLQSTNAEMKLQLSDSLKRSQTTVNDELAKGLEIVRESVLALDKGLQAELTKSLETMGQQLASLSEKFVADYGPLTDRLREVVQLSSAVRQ